ncbi:MAG: hypothetical protein ACI9YO_002151 [Gammaproteobacteria bacterium]|jgi:hypothetical protein
MDSEVIRASASLIITGMFSADMLAVGVEKHKISSSQVVEDTSDLL